MKKNYIENWCMYGVRTISVSVNEYIDEDEKFYTPQLTIILDDGKKSDDISDMKVITLILDQKVYDCPKKALWNAVHNSILKNFQKISAEALVMDEEQNVVDKFDFNEDFSEFEEEDEMTDEKMELLCAMKEMKLNKVTIH